MQPGVADDLQGAVKGVGQRSSGGEGQAVDLTVARQVDSVRFFHRFCRYLSFKNTNGAIIYKFYQNPIFRNSRWQISIQASRYS